MFEFLEFLRVVAIGAIALGLLGVIFFQSLFAGPAGLLLCGATMIGLLFQPFLRAHHPYRNDVKAVISHVETYIQEALEGAPTRSTACPQLDNALARAIYEYLYRTVEYSPFFTSRVNEQIRFFYFYFFVGKALRVGAASSFVALAFVWLAAGTRFGASEVGRAISHEFLMGIGRPWVALPFVVFFAGLCILGSRQFLNTARGIMLTELYTRHVMLAAEKERICALATLAHGDPVLKSMLRARFDKERGELGREEAPGNGRPAPE
jgi:hypothetical protein